MKVILENVRCSYVFADKPNKDGKYSIQPLVPEGSKAHKKCMKAVETAFIENFGEKEWNSKTRNSRYKLPLRVGNEEREGEEYEDVIFFNANSKNKPGIINRNKETAMPEDLEEYCYSGAYFNVSVTFYSFKSQEGGKPGIAAGFNNLMLVKKGDQLGGGASASKDFEEFAVEDFDDDFEDDI